MSELTFLEIDTDAEVEKILRQLDRFKDKLGAPDVLQKVVKTTAQKVKTQLVQGRKKTLRPGRRKRAERPEQGGAEGHHPERCCRFRCDHIERPHAGHYGVSDPAEYQNWRGGGPDFERGPRKRVEKG